MAEEKVMDQDAVDEAVDQENEKKRLKKLLLKSS